MRAKRKTAARQRRAPRRKAAATDEILGRPPETEAVPEEWKKYHDRLIQVRNYLTRRRGGLVRDAQDATPAFSLHMADAATDSYDRDVALSRASSQQEALYEIDEALDRIRDGTYGRCELTGKPIEPARLEAIPWARFSLEAEELLEREGQIQRAKLGARTAVPRSVSDGADAENADQD